MRWFIGSALALLLAWTLYVASPYWALLDLARAIEARNVGDIADRVNFRALRASLARQVVAAGMSYRPLAQALGASDANLAAGSVAVAADPLLERIVTPEGLLGLLHDMGPDRTEPVRIAARPDPNLDGLRTAAELVRSSRWRGFRNVYFSIPPGAGRNAEGRLQLRFSRLKWRLVSFDISAEARQRLLDELVRLHAERRRR
ncbi:DUF2939 domain-containing protein [Enterovirga aerilata]|uniref:DUF2939 domain-containing protein n=1 Tax=Enterovirga aerilata TaxID=2730920 RepID=A0A849IAG2_9HYPH|nr:DUF2939 domain-containing protein [Enterovirga sp. DB1703]NNM74874.1 DUF2939 domain-containing protein [Enterovirga sp. DB1703]